MEISVKELIELKQNLLKSIDSKNVDIVKAVHETFDGFLLEKDCENTREMLNKFGIQTFGSTNELRTFGEFRPLKKKQQECPI